MSQFRETIRLGEIEREDGTLSIGGLVVAENMKFDAYMAAAYCINLFSIFENFVPDHGQNQFLSDFGKNFLELMGQRHELAGKVEAKEEDYE